MSRVRAMMPSVRALVLCCAALVAVPTFSAGTATDHFRRFFAEVNTYQARFEQVVLDELGQSLERSEGRVWIQRPSRFRWDYAPPAGQQIVSDGERVWIYDQDLEQVTVRRFDAALAGTPAELLSGRGDIERNYELTDAGSRNGLAWIELRPRQSDSAFEVVRIGFDGPRLRMLELVDGLAQVTRIELFEPAENETLGAGLFKFEAPQGVDVIDEGG